MCGGIPHSPTWKDKLGTTKRNFPRLINELEECGIFRKIQSIINTFFLKG